MTYNSGSYNFTVGLGGFNYSKNIRELSPETMIIGSSNINLLNDHVASRGGTEIFYILPEVSPVTSLYQIADKNNIQRIISTTKSGNIYKDELLLKDTGSQINNASYITWNNNLIINSGNILPQVWDRESLFTTDYPTDKMAFDWVLDNVYPEIMVIYGKGNSVRAWATKEVSRGNILYYSDVNDGISEVPNFAQGGFFFISTEGNRPLTALQEFGDRLIVFSDTKAFIVDDTSFLDEHWGYIEAPWKGGVISQRLVIKTENDILCMTHDGTIYSITAVMQYGDYKISSITTPAYINNFIKNEFNSFLIDEMHASFDPFLRVIKYFGASKHNNKNDTALIYFIDKSPQTGWSLHNNPVRNSGYNARSSCTAIIDTKSKILCGDYLGRIWKLEMDNLVDHTGVYPIRIVTPFMNMKDNRNTKRFKRGFLNINSLGPVYIKILSRTENTSFSERLLHFSLGLDVFGTARWGYSKFGEDVTFSLKYSINKTGIMIQHDYTFSASMFENVARFDFARWDEETFEGLMKSKPFRIFNVTTDFTPIATRI